MIREKVLKFINENRMMEKGDNIVIGVSGGADSMCLLDIMLYIATEYDLNIYVVHINHGIRGESAYRDARFVKDYCYSRGVNCTIGEYDVPILASQWGMSHEEAGRRVIYEAFDEMLQRLGGKGKIAVAHNADDSAETILLNLIRGSGLKGMTGIQPVRDNIIRPILCLSRSEIEAYNQAEGINYVTDETNLEDEYTRNKIRMNILPKMCQINPNAIEHMNAAAISLSEIEDYMAAQVNQTFNESVEWDDKTSSLSIKVDRFIELHKAMKGQLIKECLYRVATKSKDITKQHIDSVEALFYMSVGKSVNLPYHMVARRGYHSVVVEKSVPTEYKASSCISTAISGEGIYDIETGEKTLRLTVAKDEFRQEIFTENKCTKWIDCDIMECDLQVRNRRNGDYIAVDDKGSKKKLKDYFIDSKIPKEDRDRILLVANGSEIVWIVGYRLSAAYKVNENTKHILKLQFDCI
ncbi:MAG: tRNA lysidine(34) synthetase TilS [Lachnospiraceae bacterium]|nr:tRNA lysidine(34) synthetase TilS [Lachnospiraceae bacterium]